MLLFSDTAMVWIPFPSQLDPVKVETCSALQPPPLLMRANLSPNAHMASLIDSGPSLCVER
jgi:hypothetical protein